MSHNTRHLLFALPGRCLHACTRTKRRLALIVTAFLMTLSAFAAQLKIDNSLAIWFVKDDPALVQYHRFLEDFGNDELLVTTLHEEGVGLSRARLERLAALQEGIAAVEGVERVRSLANLPVSTDEGLGADTVVRGPVEDDDLRRASEMLERGGVAARFVGHSRDTLVLYTWLEARPDIDQRRPVILDDIRAVVSRVTQGSEEQVSHVGMGVLYDEINRSTLGEGARFIGLSYVVIVVLLVGFLRSWRWTLLAVTIVTIADLTLLAAMVVVGRPLHMFTMALPALVMVLGVAHVMHIHAHLGAAAGKHGRSFGVLRAALIAVAIPCVLNGVTTGLGFGSLLSSEIAITRDFGGFAAVGVLAALGLALLGTAVALPWLPTPRAAAHRDRVGAMLERAVGAALRHRRVTLCLALVVSALSALGASRIVADTYALGFLADDHPLRRDSALVETQSGPYLPLELVLRTETKGAWRAPDVLAGLRAAQEELEGHGRFGRTLSVVDVLGETKRALAGDSTLAARTTPETAAAAAQLLEVARATPAQEDLRWLISDDDKALRLTVTIPMSPASGFRDSGALAMDIVRAHLPADVSVHFGGYLPLNWTMVTRLVSDQVRSFGLAFLFVFAVVGLALRSVRLLLVAVVANVIPVLITLGVMGAAGIRLDIATVTIAASVLGIVVDDTIHLLWSTRRALADGTEPIEAVRGAIRTAGSAIARTSVVFTLGFLVIALSDVHSVAAVGSLTAVAVAAAFATDVLLVPVLVVWLYRPVGGSGRGNRCEERVAATQEGPAAARKAA